MPCCTKNRGDRRKAGFGEGLWWSDEVLAGGHGGGGGGGGGGGHWGTPEDDPEPEVDENDPPEETDDPPEATQPVVVDIPDSTPTKANTSGYNTFNNTDSDNDRLLLIPFERKKKCFCRCSLTFLVMVSGFLFGYDTGVVSGSMLLIQPYFHLSMLWAQIIVSATVGTAALTSSAAEFVADFFGRKVIIAFGAVLFTTGAIVMGEAETVTVIIVGRIIVGFAMGLSTVVVVLYVKESALASRLKWLLGWLQLMYTVGNMVSNFLTMVLHYIGDSSVWQYLLAFGAIPSILQFIAIMLLPESPRWLMECDDEQGARESLILLRGTDLVEDELEVIRLDVEEERNELDKDDSDDTWDILGDIIDEVEDELLSDSDEEGTNSAKDKQSKGLKDGLNKENDTKQKDSNKDSSSDLIAKGKEKASDDLTGQNKGDRNNQTDGGKQDSGNQDGGSNQDGGTQDGGNQGGGGNQHGGNQDGSSSKKTPQNSDTPLSFNDGKSKDGKNQKSSEGSGGQSQSGISRPASNQGSGKNSNGPGSDTPNSNSGKSGQISNDGNKSGEKGDSGQVGTDHTEDDKESSESKSSDGPSSHHDGSSSGNSGQSNKSLGSVDNSSPLAEGNKPSGTGSNSGDKNDSSKKASGKAGGGENGSGGNNSSSTNGKTNQSTNGKANQSTNGKANQPTNGTENQSTNGKANQPTNGTENQSTNGKANQSTNGTENQSTNGINPDTSNGMASGSSSNNSDTSKGKNTQRSDSEGGDSQNASGSADGNPGNGSSSTGSKFNDNGAGSSKDGGKGSKKSSEKKSKNSKQKKKQKKVVNRKDYEKLEGGVAPKGSMSAKPPIIRILLKPKVRQSAMNVSFLHLFQQLSGISCIILYGGSMILLSGLPTNLSLILLNIPNVLYVVATYLSNKFEPMKDDRRQLLVSSFVGVFIGMALISTGYQLLELYPRPVSVFENNSLVGLPYEDLYFGYCNHTSFLTCEMCTYTEFCGFCYTNWWDGSCLPTDLNNSYRSYVGRCNNSHAINSYYNFIHHECPSDFGWFVVVGMVVFVLAYAPGLGQITQREHSQRCPVWARKTSNSIARSINWGANLLCSMTFLLLMMAMTKYGTCWMFTSLCLIGVIYTAVLLPDE